MTASVAEHIGQNTETKTAGRVIVGMNGKMTADEVANTLGVSYSYAVQLLQNKKIKAQRVSTGRGRKSWIADADDVYRAKSSGLVKQPRKNGKVRHIPVPQEQAQPQSMVKLQFDISKEKYDLMSTALASKNKTLKDYLMEQIDSVFGKLQESLNQVQF